jgi:hypothetical protein
MNQNNGRLASIFVNDHETIKSKAAYVAPVIREESEMLFTKDIWEDFSDGNWCFGCTNCNCN